MFLLNEKGTYVNKHGMVFVNQAPSKMLHFSLLQKYTPTHKNISRESILNKKTFVIPLNCFKVATNFIYK